MAQASTTHSSSLHNASDGSAFTLSDSPATIELTDTEEGIVFNGKAERQWCFVNNDSMFPSDDLEGTITAINAIVTGQKSARDGKYMKDGRIVIRKDGRAYNTAGCSISE